MNGWTAQRGQDSGKERKQDMKKFLTTASAAALVLGVAAPASAQSVLERVLAQTASLNEVTGVFANVADNI